MTDPTQEQRGVSDRSTPWTQVSHLPGYEWRLNKNGHRETRPIEKVEQGASMGPAEMTDRERAEYWYEAAQQAYRWRDINAESCRIYDDEVKQGVARQKELQAEVSKLSTRIDEYELAETKAVEELARVRDLLKQYYDEHQNWDSGKAGTFCGCEICEAVAKAEKPNV